MAMEDIPGYLRKKVREMQEVIARQARGIRIP